MYQALYRSFRPETLEEVWGQEHIVRILKNQIANHTTSHAYLFCGTRGTGKTTTARLLAKGVNCLASEGVVPCGICAHCQSIKNGTFMDVVEIDAASHNGVENIRELRESVKYPPVSGKTKVYIIDEVHMLSTGAFNALLKTLEEPPEHVMFILATTEVHKLPATILSRCLRLDFHRVSERLLKQGMGAICRKLDISVSDAALGLIAANADGSVRDGLSLLDQCIAGNEREVTRDSVLELLGTVGEDVFVEITEYVTAGKTGDALVLLHQVLADGKDVRQFMKDWIGHFRNLLLVKYVKKPEEMLNMSVENVERIRAQSERLDLQNINHGILSLSKAISDARWSTQPRILLELCVVKLAMGEEEESFAKKASPARQGVLVPTGTVGRESSTPVSKTEPVAGLAVTTNEQEEPVHSEESPVDLEEIWYRVFEEGETLQGSFNLIRNGCRLCQMDGQTFTLCVSNDVLKKYVKEHAAMLESLMAKHTGTNRHMTCILEGESGGTSHVQTDSIEELANSIERRLGVSVEIQ